MATSKEFAMYVTDACSGLSTRAMMGEYVLYYGGKVVGGIYDNCVLVKPIEGARALLPQAELRIPYEGAREMLMVEDLEDRETLRALFEKLAAELPEPKRKKK